jgi:chromosome segregation ATPase
MTRADIMLWLQAVNVLLIPLLAWVAAKWRMVVTKQAAIEAKQARLDTELAAHVARCEACAKATTKLNETVDVLNGDLAESREHVTEALAAGDTRMALIESRLEQLPSADAVHELAISVERLGGDVRVTKESVENLRESGKRQEHTLNRMEQFLLNGGGCK